MKILTLHVQGHDANATYYDGTEVKYILLERVKQVKKYAYEHYEFAKIANDLKVLNIDWQNLDVFAFDMLQPKGVDWDWKFTDGPVREVSQDLIEEAFPFLPVRAKKYYRVLHHYAHRRCADWLFGDTQKALVIDGHGDYHEHISVFDGDKKTVEHVSTEMFSIGRLYALASLLFISNPVARPGGTIDQVGKLMGLMSYGEFNESYAKYLRKFSFKEVTAQMYNRVLFEQHQYLKKPEFISECTQDSIGITPNFDAIDWIHTWQEVLFDYMIEFCKEHFDKNERFTYSGGVAHNVCFNERLSKEFPNVMIPPCVGDEGLSLGMMHEIASMNDLILSFPTGQYTDETLYTPSSETIDIMADYISHSNIVCNFQSSSEIGPRALGRRSIFYRTDQINVPKLMNIRKIKSREWWRPYGIIILEEELENYLDTKTKSPYMLHTAQVKNRKALQGVVHVDNSVRYQTVNEDDGWLYDLVKRVYELTGTPAIVNTSLNAQGFPIVYDEAQMKEYMQLVPSDIFVIGNEIYGNEK